MLQCCRGEELGYAETVVLADDKYGPPPGASAPKTRTVQIPIVKDIIIMNATVPGFVANRNTVKGSWFVQCLGWFLNDLFNVQLIHLVLQ